MKHLPIILLLVFTLYVKSHAQTIEKNQDIWMTLNIKADLHKRFYLHNEFHLRRANGFNPQQTLLRPSVNWKASENLWLSAGYTYIRNFAYGASVILDNTENNIWLQAVPQQKLGKKFSLSHRYRWEGRWVEPLRRDTNNAPFLGDARFVQRMRYRATLSYKLSDKVSLVAFDEVFLPLREGLAVDGFNQNWIYLGANFKASENFSFGGGFMQQWVKNNADFYQNNPTLQLTITYRWAKKKEEAGG